MYYLICYNILCNICAKNINIYKILFISPRNSKFLHAMSYIVTSVTLIIILWYSSLYKNPSEFGL